MLSLLCTLLFNTSRNNGHDYVVHGDDAVGGSNSGIVGNWAANPSILVHSKDIAYDHDGNTGNWDTLKATLRRNIRNMRARP